MQCSPKVKQEDGFEKIAYKLLQGILMEVTVLNYVYRNYKLSHFSEMRSYNVICGHCFHKLSFVREPYLTT